jgi:hypothetical protein
VAPTGIGISGGTGYSWNVSGAGGSGSTFGNPGFPVAAARAGGGGAGAPPGPGGSIAGAPGFVFVAY